MNSFNSALAHLHVCCKISILLSAISNENLISAQPLTSAHLE